MSYDNIFLPKSYPYKSSNKHLLVSTDVALVYGINAKKNIVQFHMIHSHMIYLNIMLIFVDISSEKLLINSIEQNFEPTM